MPRKTVKEQKQKRPTDTDINVNRVREISDSIIGIKDPDDIMINLIEVLEEIPPKEVKTGKFYIFVYNPKTPNIEYDQNPLVAVTDIFQWGFRGINFHWGKPRQYTWSEVPGGVYEVYASEIKDLQMIPFANFRLNS